MPIHRIIFRLDFKPNFDIIESPAKIMRICSGKQEGFLTELGEDITQRSITAKHETPGKDFLRSITVTPTAIVGSIETSEGIDKSKINSDSDFEKLIKITNDLRKEYRIDLLSRTGLRFVYFSKVCGQKGDIVASFEKLFDNSLIQSIKKTLGNTVDIGISFDGEHEDKILYHIKCGPYFKGELATKKYLNINPVKFDEDNDVDFILDVDMYEENHQLAEAVSLSKWCDPLVQRSNNVIEEIKLKLRNSTGD